MGLALSGPDLSVFVARVLAGVYLAASVGGLLDPLYYRRVADEMFKNPALTYALGLFTTVLGAVVVYNHNLWTGDWRVLVTLFGWIALTKGLLLIAVPELMRRVSKPFLTPAAASFFPYATLAVGLFFAYCGFVRG